MKLFVVFCTIFVQLSFGSELSKILASRPEFKGEMPPRLPFPIPPHENGVSIREYTTAMKILELHVQDSDIPAKPRDRTCKRATVEPDFGRPRPIPIEHIDSPPPPPPKGLFIDTPMHPPVAPSVKFTPPEVSAPFPVSLELPMPFETREKRATDTEVKKAIDDVVSILKPPTPDFGDGERQNVTDFLDTLDIGERKVDICFVVDVTGSMQAYINGVRDSIFEIVNDLTNETANSTNVVQDLRIAFVGYRDFDDGPAKQFTKLEFSSNVERFRDFVAATPADGGHDAAEDVMGGLTEALNLEWGAKDRNRLIFHLADAAGHGCDMHNYYSDSYATGDPLNRTAEEIFARMKEMNIDYFFGNITDQTAVMLERFAEANEGTISTFAIGPSYGGGHFGGRGRSRMAMDGIGMAFGGAAGDFAAAAPLSKRIAESVKSAVGIALAKGKSGK